MFASSWKKQSSRLKTGIMDLTNNEYIYGENGTFNVFESKKALLSDISSNKAFIADICSNNVFIDNAYIDNFFITNLGQNNNISDVWLNADLNNQNKIFVVDLSLFLYTYSRVGPAINVVSTM